MKKMISLNIRHGGGNRIVALTEWLLEQDADIIVLPEWRNNSSGAFMAKNLQNAGYQYIHTQSQSPTANGLLIASRQSFAAARITPQDASKGELAKITFDDGLMLIAAYFPQLNAKKPFFEVLFKEVTENQDLPILICGDTNTGDNLVDISGGTKFHCADMFNDLTGKYGLCDLWRRLNGDKREYTWFSSKNGFRIDHALSNAVFLSRHIDISCIYNSEPRNAGITDHSAIITKWSCV